MPAKREWTADEIERLRELTARGESSNDAASVFGVSPGHLRKIRAAHGIEVTRTPAQRPFGPTIPDTREQNWWPLPAGHPVTWQAITRGTYLEGAPYQPW